MDFCTNKIMPLFEMMGVFLTIFKLLIPLILIGLGIFDLYKAIILNEDSLLKKQCVRFLKRIVAAILIFFLPSIVLFIFASIGVETNSCTTCVLDTKQCTVETNNNSNNGSNYETNSNICTIDNEDCISNAIYIEGN